jgi:hypothetical protein
MSIQHDDLDRRHFLIETEPRLVGRCPRCHQTHESIGTYKAQGPTTAGDSASVLAICPSVQKPFFIETASPGVLSYLQKTVGRSDKQRIGS